MARFIFNTEVTKKVTEKIGEDIISVKDLGTHARIPGTGFKDYYFLVNGTFHVTVKANVKTPLGYRNIISVKLYSEIKKEKKEYGKRINLRAKKAGVPWSIAKLSVEIVDDAEAISELEKLKEIAKGIDDSTKKRLKSTSSRLPCLASLLTESKLDYKNPLAVRSIIEFLTV